MSKKRAWTRTSASQHGAFQRCQRYWYFGWIEGIKSPPTEAMQRGTDIHAEIEHYLKTGEIRDSSYSDLSLNYRPYVEALVPHLPPPGHDDLIIEHPIEMECGPGLPLWVGFIDIGFSAVTPLKIRDTKTTSDFRYAKTEKELSENIQLISYGRWAYEVAGYSGDIDLGHLYVKTEKRIVRKKPLTKEVNVVLSQARVESVWEREMETVAEMVQAAKAESPHDLPPTITSCGMYGGCPFATKCGLPEVSLGGLFNLNKKEDKMGNAFLEQLKKKGIKKPSEKTEKKSAKPEAGVLPPDAPSRETSSKESESIRAETEEKKVKAEKEKKTRKTKAKEKEPSASGFIVYIDCMPKKHSGGDSPVLFEDWFKPIFDTLDASVAAHNDGNGYWSLGYAEQKHLLPEAIDTYISEHGLPSSMIAMTGTTLLKDVLPALVPHATTVITSIRG